jgi:peptidoglycan hydrolase CwlO-like protein
METQLKINTLENQMKEVNKKLDSQDKKIDELSDKVDKGFDNIREELTCYVRKEEFSTVTSKTTYYLNTRSIDSPALIRHLNGTKPAVVTFTCAYL